MFQQHNQLYPNRVFYSEKFEANGKCVDNDHSSDNVSQQAKYTAEVFHLHKRGYVFGLFVYLSV